MSFLKSLVVNNISVKIISLVLALLTWSYIGGQIYKRSLTTEEEAPSIIKVSGEKLIVKRLPIYVTIEGEPAKGYKVELDKIVISPSHSIVAGPAEIINDISNIATEPVYITDATSTIRKRVALNEIPGCKIGYDGDVRVMVSIIREKRR